MVKRIAIIAFGLLASTASVAHAQIDNAGVLDQALRRFRDAAQGWQDAVHGAASSLFWSLATISLVWTMGQLALRRAELGEFFGELARFLLFTGFWAWMLENGPAHAQMIIDSMVRLGGSAAFTSLKSPSGVVDIGFQLLDLALAQSSIQDPIATSIGVLMALGVLLILALVGVNMLVALISCWIVAYAGLFVLGFGGSKWTSDMAINYYKMILSLGLQVFAMILLVGVGGEMLHDYFGRLEQTVSARELAVMLVVALVLLTLVNRVPALIATLVNGSSPQYALGSGAGGSAALSAISAATGVAAWSTKAAVGGVTGVAKGSAAIVRAGVGATKGLHAAWATGTAAHAAGDSLGSALVDGFRSGLATATGRSTASSGSVFSAPPPLPSASGATHERSSAADRQGPSRDGNGAAGRSLPSTSAGSAAGRGGDAARASTSRSAPGSTRPTGAANDTGAAGRRGKDSSTDARASSGDDAKTTNGGRSPKDSVKGEGTRGTETLAAATQASSSSGTRGLWTGAAAASDQAGAGRPTASPKTDPPSHASAAPGPQHTGPRPMNAVMQASSQAAVGSASQAFSSSTLLSATGQPVVMPATDGFQSLMAPPPLGAFPTTSGGGGSHSASAPQNVWASSSRELHAATQQQTAVDVEAEVAAFRDQES